MRDNDTKPPTPNNKRPAGRPNNRRVRKRPDSNTTVCCSNCGEPKHNKASCPYPPGYKIWKALNDNIEEMNSSDDEEVPSKPPAKQRTTNERSEESFF